MAPKWCVVCGEGRIAQEATEVVEGDPMCAAHAAFVKKGAEMLAAAPGPELCSRGCGKPTHRGSCVGHRTGGRQATAEPLHGAAALRANVNGQVVQPTPTLTQNGYVPNTGRIASVNDVLSEEIDIPITRKAAPAPTCNGAFRVVKRADLPGVRRRESVNLNRRVFDAMVAARPEAVEVPVEGWKAGVNLRRRLQLMARPKGLEIDWSRTEDFKTFYFWLVDGAA